MDVKGMMEDALTETLVVSFPPDMPLAECRDSLEMLVAEAWEEDYADADDEGECLEMAITPYWVWRALCVKARHETETMTDADRQEERKWWLGERERRREVRAGRGA